AFNDQALSKNPEDFDGIDVVRGLGGDQLKAIAGDQAAVDAAEENAVAGAYAVRSEAEIDRVALDLHPGSREMGRVLAIFFQIAEANVNPLRHAVDRIVKDANVIGEIATNDDALRGR